MDTVETERLLSALERIAMALEVQVGLARPEDSELRDDSAALYTDDYAQYVEEQKHEARRGRGARMPLPGEDLPEHGTNFSPREPLADATGEP
jgi:hypothetical protein